MRSVAEAHLLESATNSSTLTMSTNSISTSSSLASAAAIAAAASAAVVTTTSATPITTSGLLSSILAPSLSITGAFSLQPAVSCSPTLLYPLNPCIDDSKLSRPNCLSPGSHSYCQTPVSHSSNECQTETLPKATPIDDPSPLNPPNIWSTVAAPTTGVDPQILGGEDLSNESPLGSSLSRHVEMEEEPEAEESSGEAEWMSQANGARESNDAKLNSLNSMKPTGLRNTIKI
ncbi:unnamed protein product [Protopolystoma xenopodis]|uniref:Uncharacterized protein n=1 Tax=Protopolystoma xenopodis TaxID=117903 RepID=A0A3S5A2A0_9PLAT|nr:unnamed protein product [Protopolystoma xenopodis]